MLIDPLPIKLEQELKYEIAYAALSSAATDGRLPKGTSASAQMLVMPGNAAFCDGMFSGSRE